MLDQESLFSIFDEDDEDVETVASADLQRELQDTFVNNLDWTLATILDQLEAKAIDLQPQFQRRDAWSITRKSRLIESWILGLPVPHIVLAERHDAKGTFIILDGKQRLTTLAQFKGILPESEMNGFALKGVPLLPSLEGVTYDRLLNTEGLKGVRNAFLNQPLRTAILRGWKSEDLLHIVFHRLNSEVVPLSPQELRQALIRGPFMGFLNEYSAQSTTLQWLLGLKAADFRMRDSELLLRLLGLTRYRKEYRGDLKRFLDKLASRLSSSWGSVEDQTKSAFREIEEAIELWGEVLGQRNVGRKYTEDRYEGRLNRAVLDAQVFAASDARVVQRMQDRPHDVKRRFETLMTTDESFRRAIEATTKSIDAVNYRMDHLHKALLED